MYTAARTIKLVVVLGPTATGKSDLAVFLAKKFNGEVVSVDSRQIYRGLDIGSGKITKREMHNIPHHMLDVWSPKRTVSVARYKVLAQKKIEQVAQRHTLPILCGGSGFYIDAIINNIVLPPVPPNAKLRKKLSKKSPEKLFEELMTLDPVRARNIDKKNPRRLIRALEIANTQGNMSRITIEPKKYNVLMVGLTLPKETLADKIKARLHKRLKIGMIKEVVNLHQQGVSWKRLESLGLEYRYLAEYLQKKISRNEMQQQLETAIRQFAKRQMTWFKRNARIRWFTPKQRTEISKIVKEFLATSSA